MPAYNAASFLPVAISSILRQSYRDFELIVLNDGSSDHTPEVVLSISDDRIRFINNSSNQGLVGVRNELLSQARGEYIAWLDADDIATPRRLEFQLNAMEDRSDLVLVGGYVQPFAEGSSANYRAWKYPSASDELKSRMLFDDPVATSATMIRRDVTIRENLQFRQDYPPSEDYDFWERLSAFGEMTTIPRILARYRIHGSQSSTIAHDSERRAVSLIQGRQLERLGISPDSSQKDLHLRLGLAEIRDPDELKQVEGWLHRLLESNKERRVYPKGPFQQVIAYIWFRTCFGLWRRWPGAYGVYRRSALAGMGSPPYPGRYGFLFRSLYSQVRSRFSFPR